MKFQVFFREEEFAALRELSDIHRRDFRKQAELLVREGLERRGFLPPHEISEEPVEVNLFIDWADQPVMEGDDG